MLAGVEGDTIAAIATAAGVGGVGIVRISGPQAVAIAEAVVGAALDRSVRVGWAHDVAGVRIDRVLAFAMRAPHSFTGEDVAELHGHGGAHNLAALLGAVLVRGARLAEPGEFTRRAVLQGKLDLVRAEALLGVIHAGSERALRLAQANLGGRLGEVAADLEQRVLSVLAEIEGRIDFPDDDLGEEESRVVDGELRALAERTRDLAAGFRHGRAVQHGITVALVGAVNAGKSSLLNALVGNERALVAAEPGTTRDYLEASTVWNGVAVTLIDTAGWRTTADAIEVRGIELGERRVASADVVVVVNDGTAAWNDGARYGERAVVVRSKVDLAAGPVAAPALETSAVTGAGLAALKSRVLELSGIAAAEGAEDAFITTERQHATMVVARDALAAAVAARAAGAVSEVVALELRQAAGALAQLRGTEVGDRVLDEVFARFCIGK
ncbi:MAG TPA: tRNA uridine-5-carboxymethylaminomethyl(34) synthesis GTPase MnmE [Kofleriaceae bacterium]|nr:tRNA uridine-5-carboxymethylaminomethyl(34) synthesis GTPase MnmE [Kofleriaceae bacterium]